MADSLAKRGHHPQPLDQVRSKVKELQQGYARAHERSSCSGEAPRYCPDYQELDGFLECGEPLSPQVLVESGMETPIQHRPECHEDNPDDQQLQDEEEDDPGSGVTLTLASVPQTQEASQASSDPREGTSAGPTVSDGQATPVLPPARSMEATGTGACIKTSCASTLGSSKDCRRP